MLNIDSEPMVRPITNSRREKKFRSTSGSSTRASTDRSRTSATAASANGPKTGSGAARASGSACSPKTRATMNVASKMKPIQSTAWPRLPSGCVCAKLAGARPAIATSMRSALSQKIARQPATRVSAPPTSGPMLKPSIRNPVQAAIAAARRGGATLALTAAKVQGTANAAAKPCKARPANRVACMPARAMMQDATAKSASPTIDARRPPTDPPLGPRARCRPPRRPNKR